jgi:hypothetical protein
VSRVGSPLANKAQWRKGTKIMKFALRIPFFAPFSHFFWRFGCDAAGTVDLAQDANRMGNRAGT